MRNFVLMLLSVFFISGCATYKVTETRTDPTTKEVVVTETEKPSDFWESANLKNYYESELKIQQTHKDSVVAGINAIRENANERKHLEMTPVEKALFNLNDQLSILLISLQPKPDRIKAPTTATDFWQQNLVGVGNLLLNGYSVFRKDPFGSNQDSQSLKDVIAGRDIYINSERNDAYNLTEGSLDFSGSYTDFNWLLNTNSGNTGSTIKKEKQTSLF